MTACTGKVLEHIISGVDVNDSEEIYGIKLERVYSAYRLYIDDKYIGSNGHISSSRKGFNPGLFSNIFFFKPEGKTFSIVLQTSSFDSRRYGISIAPVSCSGMDAVQGKKT